MIGVLFFGTEPAHDLGVCDLFPEIHGGVVRVDDVEGVSAFDALGGFSRLALMPWQRHPSLFA